MRSTYHRGTLDLVRTSGLSCSVPRQNVSLALIHEIFSIPRHSCWLLPRTDALFFSPPLLCSPRASVCLPVSCCFCSGLLFCFLNSENYRV